MEPHKLGLLLTLAELAAMPIYHFLNVTSVPKLFAQSPLANMLLFKTEFGNRLQESDVNAGQLGQCLPLSWHQHTEYNSRPFLSNIAGQKCVHS